MIRISAAARSSNTFTSSLTLLMSATFFATSSGGGDVSSTHKSFHEARLSDIWSARGKSGWKILTVAKTKGATKKLMKPC